MYRNIISLPQPSYVRRLLAPSPVVLFFANVDDVGVDVVRRRDGVPPGQCSQVCNKGCRMLTGFVWLFQNGIEEGTDLMGQLFRSN